jgi:hypothetical protein
VIPGAEITQNHIRAHRNARIVALNPTGCISADQSAEDILKEIRRQGALSVACHPHNRTTRRCEIGTCYLWDIESGSRSSWTSGRRPTAMISSRSPVSSTSRTSRTATSTSRSICISWKTLLRCEKRWDAIARALRENVEVALTLYRNGTWAV